MGFVIFLSTVLMVTCSGCWSYHEIESLSVVTGIALDTGQNGYKYHMTFEILNLSDSEKQSSAKSLILETDGDTLFQAVRSALKQNNHKLYFSNCKIIIVSSALAQQGLKHILDLFLRDGEARITMQLFISKEKTAGEILKSEMTNGELTAFQLNNMLDSSTRNLSVCPNVKLYQINNMLNTDGIDLTLPTLTLKKEEQNSTVLLDGTAVFRSDKLIGFMNDIDSLYFLFTKDEIEGGILVTGEEPDSKDVSLEIQQSKTSVQPTVQNEQVSVNLDITMTAAFAEQMSKTDLVSKVGVNGIAKFAEKTLQENVERVIQTTQSRFGSDIFGFGLKIYQDKPSQWKKLKPKWNKLFPKIKYKVNAHVKITNTALIADKGGE